MILWGGLTPRTRIGPKRGAGIWGLSWGLLCPSWPHLGPFDSILKATWLPSCPLPALKTTTRPPNSILAGFRKGSRPKESSKIIDFPLVFEGFCNPTFLPQSMPTATPLSPRSASRCPLGPPGKGQGGPKRAQEGAKMGPKPCDAQRVNPRKIIFGALLGPSWGHLGPSWAELWPFDSVLKAT